jgi:predicted dehydrogenase
MGKDRRAFLRSALATGAGLATGTGVAARQARTDPGHPLVMAVAGINGEGKSHLRCFSALPDVRVKTICDVDERQWPAAAKVAADCGITGVGLEADFRRVLDDPEIDFVSIATPNHHHALQTVWACQAGKDVYVEGPASHDVWEGRRAVVAARRHGRVVVAGLQQRSDPHVRRAVELLRAGVIGEVYLARGLCFKPRESIGRKPPVPAPAGLHFDLWLGPAPERSFTENLVHYNWRWFWDFGNGEIGNQGVHELDLARWGLGKDTLPVYIHSTGGFFGTPCDQETPNVQTATFEWPDGKILEFEVRGLFTAGEQGMRIGNFFYGTEGYMHLDIDGFRTYLGRKEEPGPEMKATLLDPRTASRAARLAVGSSPHETSRYLHRAAFVAALRSRRPEDVRADILEGHLSSALCHLANASYRVGRSLRFEPETESFGSDVEANVLLSRQARAPFVFPDAP